MLDLNLDRHAQVEVPATIDEALIPVEREAELTIGIACAESDLGRPQDIEGFLDDECEFGGCLLRRAALQLLSQSEREKSKQISHRLLIGPISEITALPGFEERPAIHPEPLARASLEESVRFIH